MKDINKIPKVSVLMPVYNGGKYLHESINSILNQTYSNFELIIVDDNSSDNSIEIIKNQKDSRIKLIRNKLNIGQSYSQNRGIKQCKGDFIARFDQDDIMMENRLEKQVKYLMGNPKISAVGCQYKLISNCKNGSSEMRWPVGQHNIIYNIITGFVPIGDPGSMIKKKVFHKIGTYKKKFQPAEDYDFWLRLILEGYRIDNMDDYLIKYRIHEKQETLLNETNKILNHRKVFKSFCEDICKVPIDENLIIKYIKVFEINQNLNSDLLDNIVMIYVMLLKSNITMQLRDMDIVVLQSRLLNVISKQMKNITTYEILKCCIKYRISLYKIRKQLFKIFKLATDV